MIRSVDTFSGGLVIVFSAILFFYFLLSKRQFSRYILVGFILRLILLYLDYTGVPILHSGIDSGSFDSIAHENLTLNKKIYLTNYSVFLTFIYSITDSSRLIAQYINVLLGVGVMLIVRRILFMFNIEHNVRRFAMAVVVLLPNLIILSGILLREAWVQFFVAASLLYFIQWVLRGGVLNMILTIGCCLAASWMHAGTIGVLAGYMVAFILYSPKLQKNKINFSSIFKLTILVTGMVLLLSYTDAFTAKFSNFEAGEDFVEMTNKSAGGSAYLTWINTNSITQSLLFAPLKMIYFLFSPLPTEWRGGTDIIAFLIDGLIYLYLCFKIWRSKVADKTMSILKQYLTISILVATFVFAYGTLNSGTAMRHRAKIFPLIVVTYAVSVGFQRKNTPQINIVQWN